MYIELIEPLIFRLCNRKNFRQDNVLVKDGLSHCVHDVVILRRKISQFYDLLVLPKRWSADYEALELGNVWSGKACIIAADINYVPSLFQPTSFLLHFWFAQSNDVSRAGCPTGPFTNLELQNQEISEFHVINFTECIGIDCWSQCLFHLLFHIYLQPLPQLRGGNK